MSVSCGTVLERLPGYLEDALAAGDRRELREHLRSCEACRREIARIEPSLLFAGVAADEVSSEDVATVLSGVRAGIALAQAERKVGRSHGISRRRPAAMSRRRMAAMAGAAALAAMTLVRPGGRTVDRNPTEAVASAPAVVAPAPATGFAPAGQKPTGTFPADATIYDWNPGAASQEPRVVWIVDRSLDI
ncbi:MAG TPA: zf-HC2 domain-containing protein [Thermoanaerobaculia bacterium]